VGAPLSGAKVVTIQNGLAAESVAGRYAKDVVGCVTAIDAELLDDGVVQVGRVGGLVLGRHRFTESSKSPVADATVRDLARLFDASGIPARATDNLEGARWTKLLVNLNNALLAATGLTAQDAFARRDIPRLAVRVVREGLAVARAEGVALERIPWADPRQVALVARLPEALGARLLAKRVLRDAGSVPLRGSTLQSILRGRTTEVDFLNGEIVRRGAAHGIPTPVNVGLLEAVERVSRDGAFVDPAHLARLGA
jgi:2-dehydropantoate 2-reductase